MLREPLMHMIQVCRMIKRPPCDLPPKGTWRQSRRPLGDPVSKPNLTEVLGDICRGEGTHIRQAEPGKRCWCGWSPPDAPADLRHWGHDAQCFQLVEGGGRRRGIRMSPHWSPTSRSSWVGRRCFQPVQKQGTVTHKPQCPMTLNLPPCKIWNGYSGILNR